MAQGNFFDMHDRVRRCSGINVPHFLRSGAVSLVLDHKGCPLFGFLSSRTQGSKALYLLLVPMSGSPCVPAQVLPRWFIPHSSNIHAPTGTGAFYKTKMHSCSDQAFLREANLAYLCPSWFSSVLHRVLGFVFKSVCRL